eukprot:scaffold18513_cov84-Skeletonema_dohrnii-CCMP3373.AAC.1
MCMEYLYFFYSADYDLCPPCKAPIKCVAKEYMLLSEIRDFQSNDIAGGQQAITGFMAGMMVSLNIDLDVHGI